ncbi:hypothetical protein DUNSADRAFT_15186 [Dunaliella salina]|uniref:Uncharacterized protein n=1 Tax=Dunaliella salina TaxID=3046 RepID=A0ABQ7G5Y2_DUNSA|nr:hypothetical protein DUNSADRAFT_15186 [Dunaliella salina]|eukprot:KAF5829992.1 hypothetical protein DUNSADRAFT_15186 [Dunaliella salina]
MPLRARFMSKFQRVAVSMQLWTMDAVLKKWEDVDNRPSQT